MIHNPNPFIFEPPGQPPSNIRIGTPSPRVSRPRTCGGQELVDGIDLAVGFWEPSIGQNGGTVLARSLFLQCPVGIRAVAEGLDLEVVALGAHSGTGCHRRRLVLPVGVFQELVEDLGVVYDGAALAIGKRKEKRGEKKDKRKEKKVEKRGQKKVETVDSKMIKERRKELRKEKKREGKRNEKRNEKKNKKRRKKRNENRERKQEGKGDR